MKKLPDQVFRRVFLSLGSNLGARRSSIWEALKRLKSKGVQVRCCSSLYETEPLEVTRQRNFINMACEVAATLGPERLLEICLTVEDAMGRIRTKEKEARIIDIDILFYGQEIIHLPRLRVPHPRLAQRRFVLVPLAEIAPEFRDPVTGLRIVTLLGRCPDRSYVEKQGALRTLGLGGADRLGAPELEPDDTK